jgi:selenocysteine lyase/cysteine desulfurase
MNIDLLHLYLKNNNIELYITTENNNDIINEMNIKKMNIYLYEPLLNNYFILKSNSIPPIDLMTIYQVNGTSNTKKKNPSILNFSIGFADAASVVEYMNLNNICISSGSACNTGSPKPSHVLTAMGCSEQEAFSSIRVSFSELNSEMDINNFMQALKRFETIFKQN